MFRTGGRARLEGTVPSPAGRPDQRAVAASGRGERPHARRVISLGAANGPGGRQAGETGLRCEDCHAGCLVLDTLFGSGHAPAGQPQDETLPPCVAPAIAAGRLAGQTA